MICVEQSGRESHFSKDLFDNQKTRWKFELNVISPTEADQHAHLRQPVVRKYRGLERMNSVLYIWYTHYLAG